jgi:hypothetical protein
MMSNIKVEEGRVYHLDADQTEWIFAYLLDDGEEHEHTQTRNQE